MQFGMNGPNPGTLTQAPRHGLPGRWPIHVGSLTAMRALSLVCSLNTSPTSSSSQLLAEQVIAEFRGLV